MALSKESWRALSAPQRIAIIGATERSGPTAFTAKFMNNARTVDYRGELLFVNPKRETVYGQKCWSSIGDIPDRIDAVAISLPSSRVIDAVTDAIRHGVKAIMLHSGGFAERGAEGIAKQAELKRICAEADVACIGPNCMGIVHYSNNAAVCGMRLHPQHAGPIAAISQSGAVAAMLGFIGSKRGLSFLASTGNEAVTTMEDLIGAAIDDPHTKVIVAFVEALRRPREIFELGERARAAGKYIIAMKVGLTSEGGRVSYGHTGALTGSGTVYRQALAQAGVVMVDDFNVLAQTVELFAGLAELPKGTRLGLLGTSGGELAHAADRASLLGTPLPALAKETSDELRKILYLPAELTPINPLDAGISFESPAPYQERMRMSIRAVAEDPGVDILAVLHGFHRDDADPDLKFSLNKMMLSAAALEAPNISKPIFVLSSRSYAPDPEVLASVTEAGIPALEGTREGLTALNHLGFVISDRNRNRSPLSIAPVKPLSIAGMKIWPDGGVPQSGVFDLLRAFAIPAAALRNVDSEGQAEQAARELGPQVVMKVDTPKIVHKSDVGGVVLDVTSDKAAAHFARLRKLVLDSGDPDGGVVVAEQLPAGVEFFIGAVRDPSFGPVVACGMGGRLLELLGRTAIIVPPFSRDDALEAIERSGAVPFLSGYRGGPTADLPALADLIAKVGDFALALGDALEELDLNPIIISTAHPGGKVADARLKIRRGK